MSRYRTPSGADDDLTLEMEDELFGDLDARQALHSYQSPRSSLAAESDGRGSTENPPVTPSRVPLHRSAPERVTVTSPRDSDSTRTSSPRQSSGTTMLLADMIANAPRPNMPDSELAKAAAFKASLVIRNNPKLKGDALMDALRRAEEDVVIQFKQMEEQRRLAIATAHHSVTGGQLHSGMLEKKSGGRRNSMEMTLGTWRRRWFVLKNSCLAYYINDEDDLPRDILLFDKSFTVVRERVDSHHFEIRTTSRTLQLRANTVEECDVWCAKIMSMMRTSEFCKAHVHSSFAPMRDVTSVSALVDANDYFKAVLTALDMAASEIFIAGWWVNVDVKLRRGEGDRPNDDVTLRQALTAAACERGVKIYVLLYKEQAVAMPNNSVYAEEQLKSISDNVFVLRHPHVLDVGASLWSHHEKIVVVDRRVCFVGGIDLAPGRWDKSSHECIYSDEQELLSIEKVRQSLVDERLSSLELEEIGVGVRVGVGEGSGVGNGGGLGLGVDYWNPRAGDFKPNSCGSKAWISNSFNVSQHPKMGWHDISVLLSGVEIVSDVSRHFIQRWLHHRVDAIQTNKTIPPLIPFTEGVVNAAGGPHLSCEGILRKVGENKVGVEFSNPSRCVAQVLRSGSKWSLGSKCERSIYNTMVRLIDNSEKMIYIENQYFVCGFGTTDDGFDEDRDSESPVKSGGGSGGGGEGDEDGVGGFEGTRDGLVLNGIGLALFARISRAILANEPFKVMVVMPHLAWEFNPVQSTILHCQNESIRELLSRLADLFPDVEDWTEYISFYNLRKWGMLKGSVPVMEEIYLHDKLVIVDDRTVLLGSANINDRSLLGTRDSEIAVLLHDANTIKTKMGGEEWEAGGFAHSLRCRLWREHLGMLVGGGGGGEGAILDPKVVEDPLGDGFQTFRFIATANRKIYESCFPSMYRNEYKKIKDVPNMKGGAGKFNPNPQSEDEWKEDGGSLKNIQGHVVTAAPYFLSEENMLPKVGQKAHLMPLRMFV
ncbi:hypothetical protein TrST_g1950 [Triparma strigata]|uniref:phospholipase D n=1 Tax=Triparma strigata TaxID=1606541 RepID=A0A9W7EJY6_9STRA|nr:hypothetical protein TrST_g1950 [Triparma strigata]